MWGFLLLLLLLVVIGASIPTWPYNRGWGYAPAGGAVALLLVFLLLMWFGIIVIAWPWSY